jgi:hypothetical protein
MIEADHRGRQLSPESRLVRGVDRMTREVEIVINQADLDDSDPEFGLNEDDLKLFDSEGKIRVKVFIDHEPTEPEKKTPDSIFIKRQVNTGNSTVIVTTRDGKMLKVLRYKGNKKVKIADLTNDSRL